MVNFFETCLPEKNNNKWIHLSIHLQIVECCRQFHPFARFWCRLGSLVIAWRGSHGYTSATGLFGQAAKASNWRISVHCRRSRLRPPWFAEAPRSIPGTYIEPTNGRPGRKRNFLATTPGDRRDRSGCSIGLMPRAAKKQGVLKIEYLTKRF